MAGFLPPHRSCGVLPTCCLALGVFLCPGRALSTDLDGDTDVDCDDLAVLEGTFGLQLGDPGFVPAADANSDGMIDGKDLVLFLADFPSGANCRVWLDPDRFVPLDEDGDPVAGVPITSSTDGTIPPLEYRPGGRSLRGSGQGLCIRLEEGGRITGAPGSRRIEFSWARADFGPTSPLQFPTPLIHIGPGTVSLVAEPDQLTVEELANAFGYDPATGIPVRVHDRFDLRWTRGQVTDDGILMARLAWADGTMPLPEESGDFTGLQLDQGNGGKKDSGDLVLPYSGTFELTDGSSTPATLTIGKETPAILTLRRDGTMALQGRADVAFDSGAQFRVDLLLDDPQYQGSILAGDLHVDAASNLAGLLPNDPTNCIPAGVTGPELEEATDCLSAYARAYLLFSAAAVGSAPADSPVQNAGSSTPPQAPDLSTAALDAWTYSGLADGLATLPLATLEGLVQQLGGSAAAGNLRSAVSVYRALLGARGAVATGGLTGGGGSEAILDGAIAEAGDALAYRGGQGEAFNSLSGAHAAMQLLVEAENDRVTAGLPADPDLGSALGQVLDAFATRYLTELGVEAGVYVPTNNPTILEMNRFEAFQVVTDLLQIMEDAQVLGIDGGITAPIDEALGQLSVHFFDMALAAMDEAEAAGDVPAFAYALEDVIELVGLKELAIFPTVSELSGLPDTSDLAGYGGRLDSLLVDELNRPAGQRSIGNQAAGIGRLLRILREMPGGVTFAAPPFQRAFDRLETALAGAMAALPAENDPSSLLLLLDAGILHDALGRRFGLTRPVDWETQRLPLVADRFATVGLAQAAWSPLHQGARLLLDEAGRLGEHGEQSRRKVYLQQCVGVLDHAFLTATGLWQSAEQDRIDNPLLYTADLLLPGDIRIERVEGSLAYNRDTEFVQGAFSGDLSLPKFNFSLRVNHASFNSGGSFDLNAYGSLGLPFDSPVATFSVLERRPAHVAYDASNGLLSLAGSGRVELNNGLTFEAYLSLQDPLYEFGMAAEGLKFDLMKEVTFMMPVINEEAGAIFEQETQRDLMRFYQSYSAAMEPLLRTVTNLPPIEAGAPGAPPDWTAPREVNLEFAGLTAFANLTYTNIAEHVNLNYSNSLASIEKSLDQSVSNMVIVSNTVAAEERILDTQARQLANQRTIQLMLEHQAYQDAIGVEDEAQVQRINARAFELLKANREAIYSLLTTNLSDKATITTQITNDLTRTAVVITLLAGWQGEGAALGLANLDLDGDTVPDALDTDFNGVPDQLEDFEMIEHLLALLLYREFDLIGLDEQGEVIDTNKFYQVDDFDLTLKARIFTSLYSEYQALGGTNSYPVIPAAASLIKRRIQMARDQLAELPADDSQFTVLRFILANRIMDNISELVILGADYDPYESGDYLQARQVAEIIAEACQNDRTFEYLEIAVDRYHEDRDRRLEKQLKFITADSDQSFGQLDSTALKPWGFMQRLDEIATFFEDDFDPDLQLALADRVRSRINRLKATALSPELQTFGLDTTRRVLIDLLGAAQYAQTHLPEDTTLMQDIALTTTNLTIAFSSLGEAKLAWWELSRFGETLFRATSSYGTNIHSQVAAALTTARANTTVASKHVAESYSNLVTTLVSKEEVVMHLPGDLAVEEVFGRISFDRDAGLLEGEFGGAFSFPDLGVRLDITEAAVASDGSFSIDASTAGPLPYDGVFLTGDFAIAGSPTALGNVSGSGSLSITNGPTLSADIDYDSTLRKLVFNGLSDDLDLRLIDDFVLFDAGFGFEITDTLQEGALRVSGSAGLFAKQKPLTTNNLSAADFHLHADGVQTTLAFDPTRYSLTLDEGTLHLPDLFSPTLCEEGTAVTNGPSVSLNATNPVNVVITHTPTPSVAFDGAIDFDNLGVEVPTVTGLVAEVCTTTLVFDDTQLPILTNVFGTVRIPIADQTVAVSVVNASWDLLGYPMGTLVLDEDIELFEAGGFAFELLGVGTNGCPSAGLSITNSEAGATYALSGGIRLTLPTDVLSEEGSGEPVSGSACGSVTFPPGEPPMFALDAFSIGPSNFRLGGVDGIRLTNAVLTIRNPANLFNQSPETPFGIILNGGFAVDGGLSLELVNAEFLFEGESLPRFSIEGVAVGLPELEVVEGLVVDVNDASLTFKDPDLPIPELFAPENMVVSMTALASMGVEPAEITGIINDMQATVSNGVLQVSAGGLGMGVGPLPLGNLLLNGTVYIGGLSDLPNWFFAGRVGGQMIGQDAKLSVLLAFNNTGPIGACIDTTFGPAGISIGYGFVLSGIRGGLAFLGTTADPCDFTRYISVSPDGLPSGQLPPGEPEAAAMMSWDEVALVQEQIALETASQETVVLQPSASTSTLESTPLLIETDPRGASDIGIPCPDGDCPSAAVGILCQPHPDAALYPDLVIYKFTSLDEPFLNGLGITSNTVSGMTAGQAATYVSDEVGMALSALIPPPSTELLDNSTNASQIVNFYFDTLTGIETGIYDVVYASVSAALGSGTTTVYQAVLDAAYAGVPCPKISMKLGASFSYLGLSSFASVNGAALVSTDISGTFTDSAGIIGGISLFGIPFGDARLFLMLTDPQGLPNPSVCGGIEAALGPLELGEIQMSLECPGCNTGVLGAMGGLFLCTGETLATNIISRVAPEVLTNAWTTATDLLPHMSTDQQFAFMAELLSMKEPPPDLPSCFFAAISNSWDSIQPNMTFCGEVNPKLFGLPIVGELVSASGQMTKTNLTINSSYSISYMLTTALRMFFLPPLDRTSIGYSYPIPDVGEFLMAGLSGNLNSPEKAGHYAVEQFDHMLRNATYTIGTEIAPFGFKTFDAEGRILIPNLTNHPAYRVDAWLPPEDRDPMMPARQDLLLSALSSNLLANPLWKGTAEDLYLAYPEGSPERTLIQSEGLSFSEDYFPHGGVVGAMELSVPPALTDAPPEVFYQMMDPTLAPFDRLVAAGDYIPNYVLAFTSTVGQLTFNLPAPNPPSLTNEMGTPLTTIELMDSISNFDLDDIGVGELYPFHASFMKGYIDARFIGVPLGSGEILAIPGTDGTGALFQVTGRVPDTSWLNDFIGSADLLIELREPPPITIEQHFTNVQATVQAALDTTNNVDAVFSNVLSSLDEYLPKGSLELVVTNMSFPAALEGMVGAADANAAFYAYSPFFEPDFPGDGPVATVRQQGGMAFRGDFTFADLFTVSNAELGVQPSPINIALTRVFGELDVPFITLPGGLTVHDVSLAFNNLPEPGDPFLRAEGGLDGIDIGVAAVQPLGTATSLFASIEGTIGTNALPQTTLYIDPAELSAPILAGAPNILLHGATTNDAFSFSSEAAWTSSVTVVAGDLRLQDLGGNEVLNVTLPTVSSELTGTGVSEFGFSIDVPSGSTITAFPDTSWEQSLVIDAAGTLVMGSDGTFLLSATTAGSMGFADLPIDGLSAGATIRLGSSGLELTGTFSGGLLDLGGPVTASGTLTILPDGTTTYSAEASLPAIQYDVFVISGDSGGPLLVTLDESGMEIPGGAELAITGVADSLIDLQTFSIGIDGSFVAEMQSGELLIEDHFRLAGGSNRLERTSGGVTSFQMTGPDLTLLPDSNWESLVPTPVAYLEVASTGRFIYDSGLQSFSIPGAFTLDGQVQIGFQPDPNQPEVDVPAGPVAFGGVDILSLTNQTIHVGNSGTALAQVSVSSSLPDVFLVSPGTFSLAPGATQDVQVVFRPRSTGTYNETLTFASNAATTPLSFVGVTGQGTAEPVFYASNRAIDYGTTLVGSTSTVSVVLANIGSAPLTIDQLSESSPSFSIATGATGAVLQPGEEIVREVPLHPASEGNTSSIITVTMDELPNAVISLDGTGAENLWYTQRGGPGSGLPDLQDVAFLTETIGWTVGHDGTVLETRDAGRSWIPRELTVFDMHTLAFASSETVTNALAWFHFNESSAATTSPDASGNGHTATSPTSGQRPLRGPDYGVYDGGVRFDGTNDLLDFDSFDVPNNFTISMWVNPHTTSDGQAFLAKNDSGGGNTLIFGFYGNAYHMRIRGDTSYWGSKQAGWHHLVARLSDAGGSTLLEVFRNGVLVHTDTLSATMGATNGGRAWTLANEWDGGSRSDFFDGDMDEVALFGRALSDAEIQVLYRRSPHRGIIAGAGGKAYETLDGGERWRQIGDEDVQGWLSSIGQYPDTVWHAADISPAGDLVLGGSRDGERAMVHQTGPEAYEEVTLNNGTTDQVPYAIAHSSGLGLAVGANGAYFRDLGGGATYEYANAGGSTVTLRGNAFHPGNIMVAVGDAGEVARTTAFADLQAGDFVVTPITEDLYDVEANGNNTFAVGDGGTFASSSDSSQTWVDSAQGLSLNLRGLALQGAEDDEVFWAVGEEGGIVHRPRVYPSGPIALFTPGELDFEYLTIGESRTLTFRIENAGAESLDITGMDVLGAPFSLGPGGSASLNPGDSTLFHVRYRPTAASPLDRDRVRIFTNDANSPHEIALKGRASPQNWQLVSLGEGTVIDIDFTTPLRGYCIVDNGGFTSLKYTVNGGASWQNAVVNPSQALGTTFQMRALDVYDSGGSDLGYLVGGNGDPSCTGSGCSVIMSVDIQDVNWSFTAQSTGSTLPITDISIDVLNPNYAVATLGDPATGQGDVLQTEDSGTTWFTKTQRPDDIFDGSACLIVHQPLAADTRIIAASDSRLYEKKWTFNWNGSGEPNAYLALDLPDSQQINSFAAFDDPALNFIIDYAWFVGDDGTYYRLEQAGSGDLWQPAPNAELIGTTDLKAVAFSDPTHGWMCGESSIFVSRDGGRNWDISLDQPGGDFRSAYAHDATTAWIGGSINGKAMVLRSQTPTLPAVGVLAQDDVVDWGERDLGSQQVFNIELANLGNSTVFLQEIEIDSDDPRARFELEDPLPTQVAAGATVQVPVRFTAKPQSTLPDGLLLYLPFEEAEDALSYTDGSAYQRNAGSPNATSRPALSEEAGQVGKGLRFDGTNDRVELEVFDVDNSFSAAMWIHPINPVGNDTYLSKNGLGGNINQFLYGVYNGTYRVHVGSGILFGGPPETGWQHVAVVCDERPGGTSTDVTLYRNGVVVTNGVVASVIGDVGNGRPWTLGAEWDNTVVGDWFGGDMDQVVLVNRALSDAEVRQLANEPPEVGPHTARLIVTSDGEEGEHRTELKARVPDVPHVVTIDSVPSGVALTMDGVTRITPFAVTVQDAPSSTNVWMTGSQHVLTAPDLHSVSNGGRIITYRLQSFRGTGAHSITVTATRASTDLTATYATESLLIPSEPAPPPAPAWAGALGAAAPATTDGAANGPFIRVTAAGLSVPALGNLDVEGEMFLSATQFTASVTSSDLALPDGPAEESLLYIGPGDWEIDYEAGSHLTLSGTSPGIRVLDHPLAPSSSVDFAFNPNTGTYAVSFSTLDDMPLVPGMAALGPGSVALSNTSGFNLDLGGTLHLLQLPDASWAIELAGGLAFTDGPFTMDLTPLLPDPLFTDGVVSLGRGSVELVRYASGVFSLNIAGADVSVFGQVIGQGDASASTDGVLSLTSTNFAAGIPLGGGLTLEQQNASDAFKLELDTRPGERALRVTLPDLVVESGLAQWPDAGIPIDGIEFDSTGVFDTGKMALPSFTFDGIGIESNGGLKNNYVRLKKEADGDVIFRIRSEVPFPAITPCSNHDLRFKAKNGTLSGSFTGTFCVFSSPISLEYAGAGTCPFQATMDNIEVFFGSTCGGVAINGVCTYGLCP